MLVGEDIPQVSETPQRVLSQESDEEDRADQESLRVIDPRDRNPRKTPYKNGPVSGIEEEAFMTEGDVKREMKSDRALDAPRERREGLSVPNETRGTPYEKDGPCRDEHNSGTREPVDPARAHDDGW